MKTQEVDAGIKSVTNYSQNKKSRECLNTRDINSFIKTTLSYIQSISLETLHVLKDM